MTSLKTPHACHPLYARLEDDLGSAALHLSMAAEYANGMDSSSNERYGAFCFSVIRAGGPLRDIARLGCEIPGSDFSNIVRMSGLEISKLMDPRFFRTAQGIAAEDIPAAISALSRTSPAALFRSVTKVPRGEAAENIADALAAFASSVRSGDLAAAKLHAEKADLWSNKSPSTAIWGAPYRYFLKSVQSGPVHAAAADLADALSSVARAKAQELREADLAEAAKIKDILSSPDRLRELRSLGVSKAVVFGSFADGSQLPDSDLDVAVWTEDAAKLDVSAVSNAISSASGRRSDVHLAGDLRGPVLKSLEACSYELFS